MSPLGYLVTLVCVYYLFTLPRRWAPLPLLIATTYMTAEQALDIAGLNFTQMRIMAAVGFLRVMIKRERVAGGVLMMDRFMIAWGIWVVCSAVFHKDVGSTLVLRAAYVFDNALIYFLFRVFIRSLEDFMQLSRMLIIVLVPLAAIMLWEKFMAYNWFSVLTAEPIEVTIREGKIRAQGPFSHPILAGTVGAACLPLVVASWWKNRKMAIVGIVAALGMVYASASSGPIMTTAIILIGMGMWKIREKMHIVRWSAVGMYILLALVMKAPVYYLLAKVNLVGGSTGWHRAALIEAAINHFSEWWATGTDVTRHWMPTGVYWDPDHTDITNHFLYMGVLGGMLLMSLFIAVFVCAFIGVGQSLRANPTAPFQRKFVVWTAGAILFGHAVSFLSVMYFDQSIVYVYLIFGAVGGCQAAKLTAGQPAKKKATVKVEDKAPDQDKGKNPATTAPASA